MTADWLIISALSVAIVMFGAWHGRTERLRAIKQGESALRGERKMHMGIEANLLKLRNDALADLRNAKVEMTDMLNENAELRRRLDRLDRLKGHRLATIQGSNRHDAG